MTGAMIEREPSDLHREDSREDRKEEKEK